MNEKWLKESEKSGKGGLRLQPESIYRGKEHRFVLVLPQSSRFGNWTTGTFSCIAKAGPDAPDPALATWTADVGTPENNETKITFTLAPGAQAALPIDSDRDGVTELLLQIYYTPQGGTEYPVVATIVTILGSL